MPFYGVWDAVMQFSAHIRKSDFMKEMVRRRDAQGSHGLMGEVDCGILYGLARWHRPGNRGGIGRLSRHVFCLHPQGAGR